MLASTFGTRLFAVVAIIEDHRFSLWYYDACGIVHANETISIFDDFERFAATVLALSSSTPSRLGAMPPVLSPPKPLSSSGNWPPITLEDYTITLNHAVRGKVKVTLKEHVFSAYGLTGRRTSVYNLKDAPEIAEGKLLIIKLAYQVSEREKEQEFVKLARDMGVGHLPEVHMAQDLYRMSDGTRGVLNKLVPKLSRRFEDRTLRCIVYSRYLPLEPFFAIYPEAIPVMVDQMLECTCISLISRNLSLT